MLLSAPVSLPFQALMKQPGDAHLHTAEEAQCLHCATQMWPSNQTDKQRRSVYRQYHHCPFGAQRAIALWSVHL